MSKIMIDIDGTLFDFDTAARKELFDMGLTIPAYHAWHQWRDPLDLAGKENWIEAVNRVHSPEIIAQQTPYQDAASVVSELAEKHEIVYLSNRNQAVTYEATMGWLLKHKFPEAELICCEHNDKAPLLTSFQYIIDDRPKTLVQFVYDYQWKFRNGSTTNERKGFSLLHPSNESLTDVPGVYLAPSWVGIRHYLQEEGVL